jgi:rfaE bifunctional protein nucleotidyltransferase chain/domain
MSEKISTLSELSDIVSKLKKSGKKVVLCHGTFDLVHTGHIRHLQRAKKEGDALIVTITADKYVNKGPGRPVFNEQLRAENLAALECVDFVAINNEVSSVNVLLEVKPDIYVKGSEYKAKEYDVTGNIFHEQEAIESVGGNVLYTDEITFSSSNLLNSHFDVFLPETKKYLNDFAVNWDIKHLFQEIADLASLKVLIIGDAIVDQYHYSTALGQTGKNNIMAVRYEYEEQFAGGALAVANHVACYVNDVTLVTGLGDQDNHEDFIKTKLSANINTEFFNFSNAPTVTKRRFVDSDLSKFFEVYFSPDDSLDEDMNRQVCQWLEANTGDFDVVLVPDFGNGFISENMIEILCRDSEFLSVNTQVNSGNRGFHVINKYPRVDFASLNETELRLAAHNRHDELENVARFIGESAKVKQLAVTRGTSGLFMLDRENDKIHTIPALSTRVVDRIGAGDAFLSLASICLGGGISPEVAAFIGSAAAAIDVQIVCNREPVEKSVLLKYITTLLK